MFTQALGDTTSGFERQFRFLADQQGLGTSVGRHPSADLLPIFNASYRSLRELVTGYGYRQLLSRGTTTALPTSAVETGETYATIAVPTATNAVKQIDIKGQDGEWYTLTEVQLGQLRDRATRVPGYPETWCWLDQGSVSDATYTQGKIAISPVPNGGSYVLWTLPEFTELDATTDVFLYHTEDWRKWHMYDAMLAVCGVRDKNTAAQRDLILRQLNPNIDGTPAFNIRTQAPTQAGPRTWTRSRDYRGLGRAWG